jgi:hypothetical protein
MRPITVAGIAIVLSAALAGCLPPRGNAALPPVDAVMSAYAAKQWPDCDPTQLVHGRTVMEDRCTKCHGMPGPDHETASAWPKVVATMAKKAELNEGDQQSVLRYLLAAQATQGKP